MNAARLLRILFWAALLFAFIMAVLPSPPRLPGEPSDKIQHIIAFITLAALAASAYLNVRLLRLGVLLSLFGAVIEIVQTIPLLHRDGDVVDWAADTVAAGLVLGGVFFLRARRLAK